MKNQDYLYLDHAASTPMRKSAMDKYIEAESFGFANSSGGHKLSRNSKNLLEDSREVISELFNSAPGEIIFTSGGTEADNWTIKSLFDSKITNSNLVTSNIEHEAVLASAEWVSSNGFQTKYAKSDENGFVTKDEFINQIDDETIVASLMWGNNETGVIQPIKDISKELNFLNYTPEIIAVSKTFTMSEILPLIEYGHHHFGENKVQEAFIKWSEVKTKKKKIKLFLKGPSPKQ